MQLGSQWSFRKTDIKGNEELNEKQQNKRKRVKGKPRRTKGKPKTTN